MSNAPTSTPAPLAPKRGRLLCIDHGSRVIGLAVCDANWTVARPLELLTRTTRAADFAHIFSVAARQEVVALIVGLPDLPIPNTTIVNQGDSVRRWVSRLAAATMLPVYLWDETLSTFEAEQHIAAAREAGQKIKSTINGRLDHYAAAAILQSFIDAHRDGQALPVMVKQR